MKHIKNLLTGLVLLVLILVLLPPQPVSAASTNTGTVIKFGTTTISTSVASSGSAFGTTYTYIPAAESEYGMNTLEVENLYAASLKPVISTHFANYSQQKLYAAFYTDGDLMLICRGNNNIISADYRNEDNVYYNAGIYVTGGKLVIGGDGTLEITNSGKLASGHKQFECVGIYGHNMNGIEFRDSVEVKITSGFPGHFQSHSYGIHTNNQTVVIKDSAKLYINTANVKAGRSYAFQNTSAIFAGKGIDVRINTGAATDGGYTGLGTGMYYRFVAGSLILQRGECDTPGCFIQTSESLNPKIKLGSTSADASLFSGTEDAFATAINNSRYVEIISQNVSNIEKVSLTEAPLVDGELPSSAPILPVGAPYTAETSWYHYDSETSTQGAALTKTETFQPGKYYLARYILKPKPGNLFLVKTPSNFTVNGKPAIDLVLTAYMELNISQVFYCSPPIRVGTALLRDGQYVITNHAFAYDLGTGPTTSPNPINAATYKDGILYLDNYQLTERGPIEILSDEPVTICLKRNSTIEYLQGNASVTVGGQTFKPAIYTTQKLHFTGTGTLNIDAEYGIVSTSTSETPVILDETFSGTININSEIGGMAFLKQNNNTKIQVAGGSLNIDSKMVGLATNVQLLNTGSFYLHSHEGTAFEKKSVFAPYGTKFYYSKQSDGSDVKATTSYSLNTGLHYLTAGSQPQIYIAKFNPGTGGTGSIPDYIGFKPEIKLPGSEGFTPTEATKLVYIWNYKDNTYNNTRSEYPGITFTLPVGETTFTAIWHQPSIRDSVVYLSNSDGTTNVGATVDKLAGHEMNFMLAQYRSDQLIDVKTIPIDYEVTKYFDPMNLQTGDVLKAFLLHDSTYVPACEWKSFVVP